MGVLKNLFAIFQDQREVLDLSSFGDELALKASWDPLVSGGTNFCTHELQKSNSLPSKGLLCFKTTFASILFSGIFIIVGLVAFINSISLGEPQAILISLGFIGGGFWLWRMMKRKESVFDYSSQSLTMGGKTYNLNQICAIQLIREYVRGNKSSYYSYELNLVCSNGERINIVDHGSLRVIRNDADQLADYLSVPVWDAIDFRIPEQVADWDAKSEVLRENIG
ncbi:hypothetical protein FZX09_07325 [Synechococcus sp. MU1643]|uniref:hypothetical protein n=1 Tax=Synechococcus sp. MU1643 TaxID=2508349 RepID=UPI001CF84539|nr:hypothetical protein [Synechococcus sp. MU1643]MCB4428603.1 hypothetical protein [Synechococcus sp. MU1643]